MSLSKTTDPSFVFRTPWMVWSGGGFWEAEGLTEDGLDACSSGVRDLFEPPKGLDRIRFVFRPEALGNRRSKRYEHVAILRVSKDRSIMSAMVESDKGHSLWYECDYGHFLDWLVREYEERHTTQFPPLSYWLFSMEAQ